MAQDATPPSQPNNPEFTPGDWKPAQGGSPLDPDDATRWTVNAEVDGVLYCVATIENGAPGDSLQTEKANAHLFAASKDLYAALGVALERMGQERDVFVTSETIGGDESTMDDAAKDYLGVLDENIAQAKDALRKAGGAL